MKLDVSRPTRALRNRMAGRDGIKMPARRRASAFITWVLWSRRNFMRTAIGAAVIVGVATAAFVIPAMFKVQNAVYEQQVAAYEAQQAKKASEAVQAVADGATQAAADAEAKASRTTAAPEPSTTKAAPAPATGTPQVVTPSGGIEAAPQAASRAFLGAWMKASTAPSGQAWIEGLRPYTAPELLELFNLTDRSTVPTAKITAMTSVTVGSTAHVSALMGDRGSIALVLEQQGGRWVVTDVAPEAPAADAPKA